MPGQHDFTRLEEAEIDRLATQHGFRRKGARNWFRRTPDFVQLVNLQRSQWSKDTRYLNFALWPHALGDPPSLAESKFHFRTRAETMTDRGLEGVFAEADRLTTLAELASAIGSRRISGLVSKDLRPLLPGVSPTRAGS